ncbi:ZIP family metal transporter [Novipirellula galeiformis]|nr:ZIP family metal transporter [Novipirellula galeiformis]
MMLKNEFFALSPVAQAGLAGLFTWAVTACGAALVFLTKAVNQKCLDAMLGLSGGVMIAASYWSLLAPAIEISEHRPEPSWFPAAIGFLLGGATLLACDKLLPHLHLGSSLDESEGPKTRWRRSTLLVLAITLHNIPEGLAIGVAFGGVMQGDAAGGIAGALALTLGIGLQNFPEGTAVSMPLRMDGMSRAKAFWYGQLSAAVEPIAAVVGAAAVTYSATVLPYALSFAAGAMIFVVVEELIPESHREGNVDLATICLMIGFTIMMILDVALG